MKSTNLKLETKNPKLRNLTLLAPLFACVLNIVGCGAGGDSDLSSLALTAKDFEELSKVYLGSSKIISTSASRISEEGIYLNLIDERVGLNFRDPVTAKAISGSGYKGTLNVKALESGNREIQIEVTEDTSELSADRASGSKTGGKLRHDIRFEISLTPEGSGPSIKPLRASESVEGEFTVSRYNPKTGSEETHNLKVDVAIAGLPEAQNAATIEAKPVFRAAADRLKAITDQNEKFQVLADLSTDPKVAKIFEGMVATGSITVDGNSYPFNKVVKGVAIAFSVAFAKE